MYTLMCPGVCCRGAGGDAAPPPQLLSSELEQLEWAGPAFPDLMARARALMCGELRPALAAAHTHTAAIRTLAQAWALTPHLDIFCQGRTTLSELQDACR